MQSILSAATVNQRIRSVCTLRTNRSINPVQVPGDPVRRTLQQWNRWKWQEVSEQERIEKYKGMTMPIDEGVGRLRRLLVELGIDKKTFVLFFSDNGPVGRLSQRKSGTAGPQRVSP